MTQSIVTCLKPLLSVILGVCLLIGTAPAYAQIATGRQGEAAGAITRADRDRAIAAVKAEFQKTYVFPETVPAIIAKLDQSLTSGRYDVDSPSELAALITADLRDSSHDRHAYLSYDPARYAAAQKPAQAGGDDELAAYDAAQARHDNFGLTDLRILPGNIRYLKIDGFEWVDDETGQAYDDAMRFLKGGDAVVIDLRGNGGGSGQAVLYLVSHFMKAGTLEITFLQGNETPMQVHILDNVPAGRMIGKPLYVLVDSAVGSAAEGFAYDVQQFKLGQLVGAKTAGAANNNSFVPIAPGFMLSVSYGRPVHPISQSNWEGVGVTPDIEVDPAQALDAAQALALSRLDISSASPEQRADYAWAKIEVQARLHPVTVSPAVAQTLTGVYDKYIVTYQDGALWLARPGHPLWPRPCQMRALNTENLFAVDGVDRLHVVLTGKAMELWWKGENTPRTLIKN
ncbi:S41 family peptidase [Asticcacaulis sp. 201]|uniref:S41 family peptidase n=1 Tax=Asticcacaulis sp. 201 TaxID=3028787 RepID=UPI002916C97B|nr:S41 family peptidase [Asticcacaulis sp. 201]MDV6330971.1 S41 family peptidase [Asticcacaulis sp. 201]